MTSKMDAGSARPWNREVTITVIISNRWKVIFNPSSCRWRTVRTRLVTIISNAIRKDATASVLINEFSPKGSLDFSAKLGENVGVAGGVSYYRRKFATDNMEMDGWDEDDGIVYADTVEYRDYDVTRERISASLGFDFRVGETTKLYARGLYSQFDDQEYRRRLIFEMDEAPNSASR